MEKFYISLLVIIGFKLSEQFVTKLPGTAILVDEEGNSLLGGSYETRKYWTYTQKAESAIQNSDLLSFRAIELWNTGFAPVAIHNKNCRFEQFPNSTLELPVWNRNTLQWQLNCVETSNRRRSGYFIHIAGVKYGYSKPIPFSPCYRIGKSGNQIVPGFKVAVRDVYPIKGESTQKFSLGDFFNWAQENGNLKALNYILEIPESTVDINNAFGNVQLYVSFRMLEVLIAFDKSSFCENDYPEKLSVSRHDRKTVYMLDLSSPQSVFVNAISRCSEHSNLNILEFDEYGPRSPASFVYNDKDRTTGLNGLSCYFKYEI